MGDSAETYFVRNSRHLPPGEYLVTQYADGSITIAYRSQSWITWGQEQPAEKTS